MIAIAIAAFLAVVFVHKLAWFQGYLAGGEEAHREGYNKGFTDGMAARKFAAPSKGKP